MKPVIVDIESPRNYIIVGHAGSGKTHLIKNIIASLVENMSQKEMDIGVIGEYGEYHEFLRRIVVDHGISYLNFEPIVDDPLRESLRQHRLDNMNLRNMIVQYSTNRFMSDIESHISGVRDFSERLRKRSQEPKQLSIGIYDEIHLDLCKDMLIDLFCLNRRYNLINVLTVFSIEHLHKYRDILDNSYIVLTGTTSYSHAKHLEGYFDTYTSQDFMMLPRGTAIYKDHLGTHILDFKVQAN